MATVFTTNLRLSLPTSGTESGTWGDTVNNGLTTLVDTSIAGTATITMTSADYTLSTANGAADEARAMFIKIIGTPGTARNVIVPTLSKLYFVFNNTTGGFAQTFKTGAGSGISVPNGSYAALYCDGTNVVNAFTVLNGNASTSSAATALSGGLGGQIAYQTSAGVTGFITNGTSGQVLLANGGTAAPTWGTAAVGSVTSVGIAAPGLFTVSGSPVTGSGTLTLTYSGTALPVANGGTGLTAVGTSGNILTSNGSAWVSSAPASSVPSYVSWASAQYFQSAWGGINSNNP